MTIIKRFIAGAVCPRCGEMDKLKAWTEDDIQHRECVACDFTDAMSLIADSAMDELATRVNQGQPDPKDEIQVVKLMDPAKP
ncbi:YheV family putative zinc ribbon protein [Oceanospirillum sediminis]|uniref:YheV family putative metal-binding protein n=1 Tax=Oceanospirillum sediminis TaxID=2760088 RepID=A0A839IY71_9GAMM|nr:YheV family putative zinc ribbon protein [Oceanospirillum sediminis]MBB1489630.1 YheV family putative metal-binding protein [Oceanospirillum sediminis]